MAGWINRRLAARGRSHRMIEVRKSETGLVHGFVHETQRDGSRRRRRTMPGENTRRQCTEVSETT